MVGACAQINYCQIDGSEIAIDFHLNDDILIERAMYLDVGAAFDD